MIRTENVLNSFSGLYGPNQWLQQVQQMLFEGVSEAPELPSHPGVAEAQHRTGSGG